MSKLVTLSLALTLVSSARAAGLEAVRARAGASFGSELGGALSAMAPKDLFVELQECLIVDAKFIRAVPVDEALEMLGPCAKALGRRAGVPVSILGPAAPTTPEAALPRDSARSAAPAPQAGLELRLGAGALTVSSFMRDLRHSLDRRHGALLGHPVLLVRGDWKPL